jgi:hypothetical protein
MPAAQRSRNLAHSLPTTAQSPGQRIPRSSLGGGENRHSGGNNGAGPSTSKWVPIAAHALKAAPTASAAWARPYERDQPDGQRRRLSCPTTARARRRVGGERRSRRGAGRARPRAQRRAPGASGRCGSAGTRPAVGGGPSGSSADRAEAGLCRRTHAFRRDVRRGGRGSDSRWRPGSRSTTGSGYATRESPERDAEAVICPVGGQSAAA